MSLGNMETLSQTMAALKEKGYAYEFAYEAEEDKLVIRDLEASYAADEVSIIDHYRFEGASNPSDTSILYALETNSGHRGVLVNGYGADGNAKMDEFLAQCANAPNH